MPALLYPNPSADPLHSTFYAHTESHRFSPLLPGPHHLSPRIPVPPTYLPTSLLGPLESGLKKAAGWVSWKASHPMWLRNSNLPEFLSTRNKKALHSLFPVPTLASTPATLALIHSVPDRHTALLVTQTHLAHTSPKTLLFPTANTLPAALCMAYSSICHLLWVFVQVLPSESYSLIIQTKTANTHKHLAPLPALIFHFMLTIL